MVNGFEKDENIKPNDAYLGIGEARKIVMGDTPLLISPVNDRGTQILVFRCSERAAFLVVLENRIGIVPRLIGSKIITSYESVEVGSTFSDVPEVPKYFHIGFLGLSFQLLYDEQGNQIRIENTSIKYGVSICALNQDTDGLVLLSSDTFSHSFPNAMDLIIGQGFSSISSEDGNRIYFYKVSESSFIAIRSKIFPKFESSPIVGYLNEPRCLGVYNGYLFTQDNGCRIHVSGIPLDYPVIVDPEYLSERGISPNEPLIEAVRSSSILDTGYTFWELTHGIPLAQRKAISFLNYRNAFYRILSSSMISIEKISREEIRSPAMIIKGHKSINIGMGLDIFEEIKNRNEGIYNFDKQVQIFNRNLVYNDICMYIYILKIPAINKKGEMCNLLLSLVIFSNESEKDTIMAFRKEFHGIKDVGPMPLLYEFFKRLGILTNSPESVITSKEKFSSFVTDPCINDMPILWHLSPEDLERVRKSEAFLQQCTIASANKVKVHSHIFR